MQGVEGPKKRFIQPHLLSYDRGYNQAIDEYDNKEVDLPSVDDIENVLLKDWPISRRRLAQEICNLILKKEG